MIVSPPENKKNVTGSNVAILCEAKGFPIPTVEWTWMRVDGQMVYLPSELIISIRLCCVSLFVHYEVVQQFLDMHLTAI